MFTACHFVNDMWSSVDQAASLYRCFIQAAFIAGLAVQTADIFGMHLLDHFPASSNNT
jgi:hypothetical protein